MLWPYTRQIVDPLGRAGGAPSVAVWEFIRQGGGRIRIEFLLGYAPT